MTKAAQAEVKAPLTFAERLGISQVMHQNPELARSFLREASVLRDPCGTAVWNGEGAAPSLTDSEKAKAAAIAAAQGRGKTAFFAYLSSDFKNSVLRLSGAEGAEAVASAGRGRTSFFAALPGTVKYDALQRWQEQQARATGDGEGEGSLAAPARGELAKLSVSVGVPMIGFGFADNFLMITFGETIDSHFSQYVSTMAAAGLGNLMSNLVGLRLADAIEQASERMGLPTPRLSAAQRATTAARIASFGGLSAGVTIGCLLGMSPLLFVT
ncbi:Hypothetical protein EMIHUDRAFT_231304 [Emiliania huxleyi CCMP1516]|uniref:Uncharacterized protein n=2 Tax=Emiliania huxleyi TaxID=2903 RepID=A0A0D3K7Y1_EMIH1|nr:Hypothetical protein EMIHUDRAFT_231304 [Emiliania huxleyi CCMP1516]EOD31866.1 Hypothetical protein EMIHUDRAFT_231304 [Emiliania huxleyi CCMP1516]|eukprot:XP_005784295.1 Hypothetical protein EMIHUDRAFT_231304 [Emiliania huxleyi CCMP1516]